MADQVSMEEFGIVSVDYFHGRKCVGVTTGDGDGKVWSIVFAGEAFIHNYDPTIPIPTAIVDAALTRTLLSTGQTRLQFGLEQVTLNPLEYTIQDLTYTKGKEVFAQRSNANMPMVIPDEPEGRTADGPSALDNDGA